jgi:hypothetical protein
MAKLSDYEFWDMVRGAVEERYKGSSKTWQIEPPPPFYTEIVTGEIREPVVHLPINEFIEGVKMAPAVCAFCNKVHPGNNYCAREDCWPLANLETPACGSVAYIKEELNQLTDKERQEIYVHLYALGCRINR